MGYADLKNDYVFRKVFGEHPEVLRGLLNDLLDRSGPDEIASLEYLPGEQAPLVFGQKLSILDVRCRAVNGAVFVVEMQNLHVTGFINRVVYNACKAYVGTLMRGRPYHALTDVVAVSICNFQLWSDAEQEAAGQPLVPMVSRWRMTEKRTGVESLEQVQYVFLELPKLGDKTPETPPERWAALFIAAPMLDPAHMAREPLSDAQREALALAREESFTAAERDAIERAFEEVDSFRRTVEAEAAKALKKGAHRGVSLLVRQFERRLTRALRDEERATLTARLMTMSAERLGDVVLDLTPAELSAWLADPKAQ